MKKAKTKKKSPDSAKAEDFLPIEAQEVLKTSENKFSVPEQILLTLLAQIVVEIIIKEEL